MTGFSGLVSVVRDLVRAVWGSLVRAVGGSNAPAAAFGELVARRWAGRAHPARVALLVMVGVLGVCAAPAGAAVTRPLVASFGPDGTSASSFAGLSQLAFDQASGRVFALDTGASELYGFDVSTPGAYSPLGGSFPLSVASPSGAPDIAADNTVSPSSSAGDIYYVSEATQSVYGYGPSGAALGGNYPIAVSGSDICGAAVDPSGNVWVGDYANQQVREYDSSGNPVGTVSTSGQGNPCHVAFDANGDMYVAMYFGAVWKYPAPGYSSPVEIDPGSASALTVDRTTHDMYVAHAGEIDAYDSSGNLLSSLGANVSGANWAGVAVDEATGDVYAADSGNQLIRVFGPQATVPDVTTGAATNPTTTSATLNGTVNPAGVQLTDCHFDYGTSASYGQSAPCVPAAGSIPADSNDHQVSADVTGLTSGSVYHYQLVAANANGANQGGDQTFSTGPAIDSESVVSVGTDTATLTAQINPQGAATTYHVDYGTTNAYAQSSPESAPIGSDNSDHTATVKLTGLTAGTTYHFRFVATDPAGATDGPDRTFTTYGPPTGFAACPNDQLRAGYSAYLPDCRAYEQASSVDKGGGNAEGGPNSVQAASGGGAVIFGSEAPLPGSVGAQDFPSFYESSRAGSGWSTQGLLPPESYGIHSDVVGWTPDLSFAIDNAGLTVGGSSLLLRSMADGSIQTIAPPTADVRYSFAGGSADDSKIFFEAIGAQLTPDAAAGQSTDNLYVWDRDTSKLSLVGVLPPSAGAGAPAGGSFAGAYDWWDARFTVGGAESGQYTQAEHAVSADGSRAYFTAGGSGQIYLREDPASGDATTVEVSASQRSTPDANGPQPAAFMDASADGSEALFTSQAELTNNANTGSADQGNDLYRFDVPSGALTDLTPDPSDPNGADVQGVLGASADGSYVYFAANGVLADGASPGDCRGRGGVLPSGTCSLYLWHDGNTKFVARLSGSDETDWVPVAPRADYTARVTPDGRTILFRSERQLTTYDNQLGCGNRAQSACPEFYRYSVSSGELHCASCVPTGTTPSSAPTLQSISTVNSFLAPAILTRNLSSSGDQVFFETADPLVAGDTNGVQDVYEWEADGAGSCHSTAQDGGCLYLLSTGRGADPSYFADASSSGDDAFIFTDEQLVGQDGDDAYDVYDARVDGGLASQNASSSVPCSGDACRGAVSALPPPPTAATVSFSGPGNASAPAPSPRTRVLSRSVHGSVFMVRVRVPARGRITITGHGIKRVSRVVGKAGTYGLRVHLTAKAGRLLARRHKLSLTLQVTYGPAGGSTETATVRLTVKPARHHRRQRATRAQRASRPYKGAR